MRSDIINDVSGGDLDEEIDFQIVKLRAHLDLWWLVNATCLVTKCCMGRS